MSISPQLGEEHRIDVPVGTITDNIPTAKVFGWGLVIRREASSNFTESMFDSFLFQGRF